MTAVIASNVRALRKRLGLNQQQFADRLNVQQSYISKWESDRVEPQGDSIAAMASLAKCTFAEFKTEPLDDDGAEPDQPPVHTASEVDGAIEVRQLDLSYAMGPGTNTDDWPEEIPVLFDPNWLRAVTRAPAHRLFVARGSGDSMFPTLINDDQVLIDTTQRQLNQQDRVWAVSVHGASMIKRLRSAGGGKVRILSDNPTVPPDEVDSSDLHIVGRVIWVGRRV